jgi:hypothetical protein
MASIMDTLFGVSAERFQQERDAAAEAQALQYARLSPIERASLGVQRGAYGLAGALGGALGGTDPELQRRTQAQQILGMIDPSKPETFFTAAQIAADRGDQQLAFGLRMEGDKYKQQAFVRADEAQTRADRLLARQQATQAQAIAQTAYQPGTPERAQMLDVQEQQQMADQGTPMPENIAAVAPSFDIQRVAPILMRTSAGRAELKNLVEAQKLTRPETISVKEGETLYNYPTSPGGEYKPVITGGAKPTPFTGDMANAANLLYRTTDPSKIFAQAGQQGIDAVNAKALEITIAKRPVTNVTNTVSNNMQRGFGDTLTETISSNIKAGRAAVAANSAVQSMQTLLDEGVRTGFGQDTMLQLGRAGQFFDPEFKVKGLAGQEAFQSFATGVILPQVKQLGVNPTDADLKFISTGSPGLSKTPEGNKLLLSALQLKLNREQDLAKFTNQFLASNQELVTKNPVQAYTKFNDAFDQYTQTSPLYGPAADSLRQRFNALGSRSTGNPAARDALQRGGLTN